MLHFWTAKSRKGGRNKVKVDRLWSIDSHQPLLQFVQRLKKKAKRERGTRNNRNTSDNFRRSYQSECSHFPRPIFPFFASTCSYSLLFISLLTTRPSVQFARQLSRLLREHTFRVHSKILNNSPAESKLMACIARALPPRNEWKSRAKEKEKKKKQVEKWAPWRPIVSVHFITNALRFFFQRPAKVVKVNVTINIVIAFTFRPAYCVDLMASPSTIPSLSLQSRRLRRVDT